MHCRAGHGRSAAAVMAWLLHKDPTADPRQLNRELCQLRNVRPTLWNQTNLIQFHTKLKQEALNNMKTKQEENENKDHRNHRSQRRNEDNTSFAYTAPAPGTESDVSDSYGNQL